MSNYMSPSNDANQMDICTSFINKLNVAGWPKIVKENIELVCTEEFRAGLAEDDTTFEGLKTFGATILYEVNPVR
jgi:hypothetical protein